jgi:hypothetical protein
MKKTVIAHFYNEEFMMEWWLNHHTSLFDHGILINHKSTDRSVEIIRDIAPDWSILDTSLEFFDAFDNEFEVMNIESNTEGWKMVLNITEFLIFPNMDLRLKQFIDTNVQCIKTKGIIMVDDEPGVLAREKPLVQQKKYGFLEYRKNKYWKTTEYCNGAKRGRTCRERILHRYSNGAYHPGRHDTYRPIDYVADDIFTLWYGYSPWCNEFIERKMSFKAKIPEKDLIQGRSKQHIRDISQLKKDYSLNLKQSKNLSIYF